MGFSLLFGDLDTAILDHYSALLVVVQIQTCFGI